jgi:hypothetical protein
MRGGRLIAVLFCTAQALAPGGPAHAEDPAATPGQQSPAPAATPANQPPAAEAAQPQTNPVVASIRAKLAEPSVNKGADAGDLAALQAFYAARAGAPLWVTEMGFAARGQAALFEIGKADDWASRRRLRSAAGGRAAGEARRPGKRRDQARSRHPEICPLRPRRTPQPARDQRALRPGAAFARS